MFKVQGSDELKKALMSMDDKAPSVLTEAVNKAGDVVLVKIQSKAPGKLAGGLMLTKSKGGRMTYTSTVSLKKGYAYGVPVELGHGLVAWGRGTDIYIDAQPFMRPGADESTDEVERIINAGLEEVLKAFGG